MSFLKSKNLKKIWQRPAAPAQPSRRRFPSFKQWKRFGSVLSRQEKKLLYLSLTIIFLCLIFITGWYAMTHRVNLPAVGGEYTEGLIGEPQFINPLYAPASDVDADLTYLIYSGLLKWNQDQGLVNDLAESYTVSEDGLTYTFTLRDDAHFHNNDPVRTRDVLFTIESIKNPLYRSPLAGLFRNVSTTQIDDWTVEFQLAEPFAPFLSQLTVGIMPAEIWGQYPPKSAQLAAPNLEPIGSGPYRFKEFTKDKKGTIHSYTLTRNPDYYGQEPWLETLTFKFYPDTASAIQALANRNIEGLSYVPPDMVSQISDSRGLNTYFPTVTRQTALFFNQANSEYLKSREIRKALALTVDKKLLVNEQLGGHAQEINSAILPGFLGEHSELARTPHDIGVANSLLAEAGYPWPEGQNFRQTQITDETGEESEEAGQQNNLHFILTTVNFPELLAIAEALKNQFADIGVALTIDTIEPGELYSRVIQPRAYEILLTTLVLGSDPDPYLFWHSSQAKEDGLNLANYANRKADTLLEEARVQTNPEERAIRYRQFQEILAEDLPAIFLYQSVYPYAVTDKIKNIELKGLINPSDRFQNIENWYSKTKKQLQ